jgi:hypothetical protein
MTKVKKILKDPFQPKRPINSFIQYYVDNQKDIVKANPNLNLIKHSMMAQIAGNRWSDDDNFVEEKANARAKAKDALARYRRIMDNYEQPSQEELWMRKKLTPKRFRVNYNYFIMEKFAPRYNKMKSFGNVSKTLAFDWKSLTEVEKKPYNDRYKRDKIRWIKQMKAFKAKFAQHLDVHE